jgi:streptogramin lyase
MRGVVRTFVIATLVVPSLACFESFPSDRPSANVRQILGRRGEVWAPESGADRLVLYRTRGPGGP